MKSKQEILDHLATTVYTHNARKSIIQWMLQHHVVDYKCQIKFAKHVYNRDGVKMTEGLSLEDFAEFVESSTTISVGVGTHLAHDILTGCISLHELNDKIDRISEETAAKIEEIYRQHERGFSSSYYVEPYAHIVQINSPEPCTDDFQIGDAVKYMPTPDESFTEYVEAIATGSNGETYLCLSNGEYIKTCYCVKYKAQGEERQRLIDKLNEVI